MGKGSGKSGKCDPSHGRPSKKRETAGRWLMRLAGRYTRSVNWTSVLIILGLRILAALFPGAVDPIGPAEAWLIDRKPAADRPADRPKKRGGRRRPAGQAAP